MKVIVVATPDENVMLQIVDDADKILWHVALVPNDAEGVAAQIVKCADMIRRGTIPTRKN